MLILYGYVLTELVSVKLLLIKLETRYVTNVMCSTCMHVQVIV